MNLTLARAFRQRVFEQISRSDQVPGGFPIIEHHEEASGGGQIIDLTEMLKASLAKSGAGKRPARAPAEEVVTPMVANERKGAKRATQAAALAPAPARARSRK